MAAPDPAVLDIIREDVYFLVPPYDIITKPYAFPDPATISPVERRLAVKSIFSAIEAMLYQWKQITIQGGNPSLTPDYISFANEEWPADPAKPGSLPKKRKIGFIENFAGTFKLMEKVFATGYNMDLTSREYQALLLSVGVRDRLMHPKSVADLTVTDVEIIDALRAYEWVWDQTGRIIIPALGKILKKPTA